MAKRKPFELFQDIMKLQIDIFIYGCTETRTKRIIKLLSTFLPAINVEPTEENVHACWFEG